MALASTPNASCPLDALAAIAAQSLVIALPESPQGKPFIDKADTSTPAAFLRAMRRSLNLTQREFGILLSPNGVSPISPSVICQFESALQAVPPLVIKRAVAITASAQRLGEYLTRTATSTREAKDAASALRLLGPGCIDQLQAFLDAFPEIDTEESQMVKEYLSIVTKRRHTTGGSRPGARGPYKKLSKLSSRSLPVTEGCPPTPPAATSQPLASNASRASPRTENTSLEPSSGRSTPSYCSTPGSSRGSSRPRSPASTLGYDSSTLSDRYSDYSTSYPSTPNGRALTPIGNTGSPRHSTSGAQLEVIMALRRLQEENDSLVQENKRLRAMVPEPSVLPTAL